MISLRRQFIKRLLWPLVAILLLGALVAYMFALRAATDAYDLGLLDDAHDLANQVTVYKGVLKLDLPAAARQMLVTNNEDRVTYAAWDAAGRLFSGDPNLQRLEKPLARESHAFQDTRMQDEESRAVVMREKIGGQDVFIAVAQTMHGRNRLSHHIFLNMLLPEAILALITISVILFGVRSGLSPVELLRDEILSRSPNDLRPIEEATAPAELRPIIHGINELLDKLTAAFASHRRFIADAAHQLRTPLAVLGSQIEVNLEQPPEDTRAMLRQLLGTTQRTSHLANQLLSLARLEHTEQAVYEKTAVDLSEVVRTAAGNFVTQAARKGVELDFKLQPCQVHGSPLFLRELLSNLLDNAVRYVPTGGRVAVEVQFANARVLMTVEDNGPGVPENELANLGVPFHRMVSDQEGCGLGLAIVREIARLHDAEVYFSRVNEAGGLRVTLVFNPP